MLTLIRKLFWLSLFLIFTLGFVTLFDHGFVTSQKFSKDAQSEVSDLMQMVHPIKRPPDTSDQPPAQ
jgi:hypothetical protein